MTPGISRHITFTPTLSILFAAVLASVVFLYSNEVALFFQNPSRLFVPLVLPARRVETCKQWWESNRESNGYMHYVMIGAQKSGTSHLSKIIKLHERAVSQTPRIKEFHFYDAFLNRIGGKSGMYLSHRYNRSVNALRSAELSNAGFKNSKVSMEDLSANPERYLFGDATPKYMLSPEIARLVHILHPHVRVLVALREPVSRAISHVNMFVRESFSEMDRLGKLRAHIRPYFDFILETEMQQAVNCGWNVREGRIEDRYGAYADAFGLFAQCVRKGVAAEKQKAHRSMASEMREINEAFRPDLFVIRGLYKDILQPWVGYFPTTRIQLFSFQDIACDMSGVLKRLESFLCMPPFSKDVYERYALKKCSVAKSTRQSNSSLYIYPSEKTQKRLRKFYAAHNDRLKAFVNTMFPGQVDIDWG